MAKGPDRKGPLRLILELVDKHHKDPVVVVGMVVIGVCTVIGTLTVVVKFDYFCIGYCVQGAKESTEDTLNPSDIEVIEQELINKALEGLTEPSEAKPGNNSDSSTFEEQYEELEHLFEPSTESALDAADVDIFELAEARDSWNDLAEYLPEPFDMAPNYLQLTSEVNIFQDIASLKTLKLFPPISSDVTHTKFSKAIALTLLSDEGINQFISRREGGSTENTITFNEEAIAQLPQFQISNTSDPPEGSTGSSSEVATSLPPPMMTPGEPQLPTDDLPSDKLPPDEFPPIVIPSDPPIPPVPPIVDIPEDAGTPERVPGPRGVLGVLLGGGAALLRRRRQVNRDKGSH
ncbi:MAG: hypothetical protein AAF329_04990 [Cyanobacteria bacterium P01_A01_bin.17]